MSFTSSVMFAVSLIIRIVFMRKDCAERKLHTVSASPGESVIVIGIDAEGLITLWNAASEEMTGTKSENAIGRSLWQEFDIFKKYSRYFNEVIEEQLPRQFYRSIKLSKPPKIYDVHLFPVIFDDIKGMVIRADDVTELEKNEETLRQAQKMETVGTLAGGIAHDFNNILAIIVSSTSVLQFELEMNQTISQVSIKEYLQTVDASINRAIDMVQQILALSHKQEFTFSAVDLNDVFKHVYNICKHTFDKSIELDFVFSKEPVIVNADLTQITQVLLNLCINAYHAMTMMRDKNEKQGGDLSVSSFSIKADSHFCKSHPEAEEKDYWVISVHDTGVGLESKNIAKIFDPFYTTKGKGEGTGLGLAMVYSIVKKHNGFIDVYSEAGLGSTFNLFLPALHNEKISKSEKSKFNVPKGEGLILIIDDESSLCEIASKILKDCGYSVISATNPVRGVEIFSLRHHEIKAVLLDLVMPRMSGKEVYIAMKKIDPDVKVLLFSGFKRDNRVKSLLEMGVNNFLQKPYNLETLARAIHNVIYETPS
jgi:two-component system cell cycle sensor histidine kinase/response regulator CckA